MSLISKNGSGGAGQKRIWSHGDLFRELFRFLWNLLFFKTPIWRHHELNLEKRVPGSRSKVNLEPRRPVSWTFSILVKFYFFGWLLMCTCTYNFLSLSPVARPFNGIAPYFRTENTIFDTENNILVPNIIFSVPKILFLVPRIPPSSDYYIVSTTRPT